MSASAADLHHHLGFVGESEKQPMETEKQPMATEAGGSGAPARGKKRPPSPDLELDTTAGDADDEWLVSDSGEEDEEDDGNQGTHGPYTVDDFPRATCEYEEQNHIMFMDPDIELRGPSPNRLFPAFKYGGHQFKSGKHLFRSDYNLCDTSKLSVTSVEDCSATCRRCSTMFLLQFINVEIAGYRHTRPGPARIYGFIAARDKIKPLRNYVYRREIGNSKALLRSQKEKKPVPRSWWRCGYGSALHSVDEDVEELGEFAAVSIKIDWKTYYRRQSMEFPDEKVQVDALERQLLSGLSSSDYNTSFEDEVLYDASFAEMEDNFVKYQIAQWILLSVLLILAWGVGVLMLLYLPIRIYVCRRDFRSRKLYLTPHAVVYKVNKPVAFPCFGIFKKEKYCILPSISDVVVEQGYLQSFFGVYSIRIENIGVRKLPSDDVKITGVTHPHDFRKAVLLHLLNTRNQNFSRKASSDNQQGTSLDPMTSTWEAHGYLMLEKLDEVEISVKKMQSLLHGVETSKMKTTSS